MTHFKEADYYQLLEITPDAGPAEVDEAYQRQMELLSGESLATYGLFVADDLVHFRQRVEEAYRVLRDPARRGAYDVQAGYAPEAVEAAAGEAAPRAREAAVPAPVAMAAGGPPDGSPAGEGVAEPAAAHDLPPFEASGPAAAVAPEAPAPEAAGADDAAPAPEEVVDPDDGYDGPAMRAARERRGLSLATISGRTRIAEYYLEHIESEQFDTLPPPIYLRSYLRQYAAAIGVDENRAVEAYMARYNQARGAKQGAGPAR